MSNEIAHIKALTRPEVLCAVRFRPSRKQLFKDCVVLAKRADFYTELEEDGVLYHYCAFEKSLKGAKLAYTFLEKVRKLDWHLCFFKGEITRIDWRLLNVMACYAKGVKLKNYKAYCHVESKKLFRGPHEHVPISFHTLQNTFPSDENTPAICPCRELEQFAMLKRQSDHSLIDQLQAKAVEQKIDLCPLFDVTGFRELIPGPPRYWR